MDRPREAASSPLAWTMFDLVFGPWMDRKLRVHLAGRPGVLEPGFPVVIVANHESWWDGFLLRRVQRALRPDTRFHTIMLERELRAHPFLRYLGGIGVAPGSLGSARRLLRTLHGLRRSDPSGVLAYFPQGRIWPGAPRPLAFRPGVLRVLEAMAPATVVPVGIRVLPGVTPRQEAYLSVGEPVAVPEAGSLDLPLLEAVVAEELDAIAAFVARHGERAPDLWPRWPGRLPRSSHTPVTIPDMGTWISRN